MRVYVAAVSLLVSALGMAGQIPTSQLSPAQQKIQWAEKGIEKNPQKYQPYNDLALALARKARETSDATYYEQAGEALRNSFRLAPDNFEGQKIQVLILLDRHEFAQARDRAQVLNRRMPDDVLVYGYLTDADIELGDYDQAEKAAQWMLDLRPGNIPGLLRGAHLRKLFGDIEGAIDFLNQACQETPPNEVEELAWILTQMADLQLMTGKVDSAEKLLQQALRFFSDYYFALESLARVRTAQHKYAEAVDLLRQRTQNSPHPESVYGLAEALKRAGRADEAKNSYAEFEREARRQIAKADNANRELIFYYADHARNPAEALQIARLEIGRRHDVYTLDAYAWALYANGECAEARRQIEKALAVGIRDSKLFYHAGVIASKLNDPSAAARYLKQSLELNPFSEVSTAAREALNKPSTASAVASSAQQ